MSRVATPPTTQPAMPTVKVPHEKIAMRAYEKWVQSGRPMGMDLKNWLEAEAELRMEFSRSSGSTPNRR